MKRFNPIRFLVISTLLIMGGCGFSPLYMENDTGAGVNLALSEISISPLEGRSGQIFRTTLSDQLSPYGSSASGKYELQITLNETREGYGFRLDEAVTRENNRLEVGYNLILTSSGNVLTSGSVRSDMAYDIVQSDFANSQVREDALLRNIESASQKLSTRLALFFKTNPPDRGGNND